MHLSAYALALRGLHKGAPRIVTEIGRPPLAHQPLGQITESNDPVTHYWNTKMSILISCPLWLTGRHKYILCAVESKMLH